MQTFKGLIKPSNGAIIRRDHPLAKNFYMGWPMLENGGTAMSIGRVRYGLKAYQGAFLQTNNTLWQGGGISPQHYTLESDAIVGNALQPWSMAVAFRTNSSAACQFGKNFAGLYLNFGASSTAEFDTNATAVKNTYSTNDFNYNGVYSNEIQYRVVVTFDGTLTAATALKMYLNGRILTPTANQNGTGTSSTTSQQWAVGPASNTGNITAATYCLYLWDRVLSPEEAKMFSQDPWCLFRPNRFFQTGIQLSSYVDFSPKISEDILLNEGIENGLDVLVGDTRDINIFDSITVDDSFNSVIPDPIISVEEDISIDDTNSDNASVIVQIPYYFPYPTPVTNPFVKTNSQRMKPTRGATINRNHPLSKGLIGVYLFTEGGISKLHDYSGNGNHLFSSFVNQQSINKVASPYGSALEFNGGSFASPSSGSQIANQIFTFNPQSVFVIGQTNGLNQDLVNRVGSRIRDSGANLNFVVDTTGTDLQRTGAVPNGGFSQRKGFKRVGFTWNGGLTATGVRLFAEGSECIYTNTTDGTGSLFQALDTAALSFGFSSGGAITVAYFWNRELSPREMISVHAEPFALFNTSNQVKYYSYFNGIFSIRTAEDITVTDVVIKIETYGISVEDDISVSENVAFAPLTIIPPIERTLKVQYFKNITKPKDIYSLNLDNQITRGIVGAWPFNEAGGQWFFDASPNKYNAVSSNKAGRWIASPWGPAYEVGTTENITIPSTVVLGEKLWGNYLPGYSFYARFMLNGTNPSTMSRGQSSIVYSTTGATANVDTTTTDLSSQVSIANLLDSQTWHRVLITVDTSSLIATNAVKIYINGSLYTANSNTNGTGSYVAQGTGPIFLLQNANFRIEHLVAWNRVLSAGEAYVMMANPYDVYLEHSQRRIFLSVVPQFQPNVFDNITVSENVEVNSDCNINVNDSITVSENITIAQVYCPIISDVITVSESLTTRVDKNPNVSDSITVSENVTITNTTLPINVSDSITVTENYTTLITSGVDTINVSESVTISESLTVDLVCFISVFDSITLTESISRIVDENPNVSNSITVSESLTIDLINCLSVSDSITVSESITKMMDENPNVNDSITVSESITVSNLTLPINVSDSITISESIVKMVDENINKSDTITVSENFTIDLVCFISVNNIITLTESVTIDDIFCINVNDNITVSESKTIAQVYCPVVSDSIIISESITKMVDENINTSDSLIIMDVGVEYTVLTIGIADAITVSENKTITNTQLGDIVVSEVITITDVPTLQNILAGVSQNDTVTLSENIVMNEDISHLSVIDSISLTENWTVNNSLLPLSIYDTLSISENIQTSLDNFISTFETLTLSDIISISNLFLPVSVSDSITLSEFLHLLQSFNIFGIENVTVSELANGLVPIDLSTFDNVSVQDLINLLLPLLISVSDSISVNDIVSETQAFDITLGEDISISESASLALIIVISFLLKSKLVTSLDFNSKLVTSIDLISKLDITEKKISELTETLKIQSDMNDKINLKSEIIGD